MPKKPSGNPPVKKNAPPMKDGPKKKKPPVKPSKKSY